MMDEALRKSGDWPNIALKPGTLEHAATGEHVEQPENTRIGHSRGACRPIGAPSDSEPADVENGAQNGLECDTREKLEERVDSLTAERDELRSRLKTQADSFAKLERDNAQLRDKLERVRELAGGDA